MAPESSSSQTKAQESPAVSTPDPSHEAGRPLYVDLDGTLIKGDLLWESLFILLGQKPQLALNLLFWGVKSRSQLK
ncbi:MAG: hypothetical protein O7G85_07620 [Planctomycetota bacterium]|nr:hypothetical protein [Planctomycetota bacterium]